MVNWNAKFAARTGRMRRSSIREILKLTQRPDVISFAGGLPAPELFPIEQIRAAADRVLTERGAGALQYSTSEGIPELRSYLAARMSRPGLTVSPDNILIVQGGQQAIDLVGRILFDEGDRAIVESPTYLGMLVAWRAYNLNYLVVPTDQHGLITELLPPALRQNPKLMYLVPNFQNPQGVTLSGARRAHLAQLAAEHGSVILEDNPYGDLRYSGEDLPSLYAVDAQVRGLSELNGGVIYTSSFSKILAPGLRMAWIAAPVPVIDKLVQAKQGADLQCNTFSQYIAYEVCKDGFIDAHILRLRDAYRQRRDVMLAALEREFPEEARWSKPDGGLFLMVHVPQHINATELLKEAIERKVAYVPGDDFHVEGGQNTFRLNYSNASPEMIEEGIRRLGALLKEVIVRQPA